MSNISMSDAELLKFAIENGMLDAALVVKPQIISGDFRRLYKVEIPVTVCG